MNDTKTPEKWTEKQMKYIEFLGRGKKDKLGKSFTNEGFAKAIGVDPWTLYQWKKLPGFRQAMFECSLAEIVDHIPELNAAMLLKAAGAKPKADVQAYMALMRQFELLKSDKVDHTTNGKDLPSPILSAVREPAEVTQ